MYTLLLSHLYLERERGDTQSVWVHGTLSKSKQMILFLRKRVEKGFYVPGLIIWNASFWIANRKSVAYLSHGDEWIGNWVRIMVEKMWKLYCQYSIHKKYKTTNIITTTTTTLPFKWINQSIDHQSPPAPILILDTTKCSWATLFRGHINNNHNSLMEFDKPDHRLGKEEGQSWRWKWERQHEMFKKKRMRMMMRKALTLEGISYYVIHNFTHTQTK